jgi:perosamine synthetase
MPPPIPLSQPDITQAELDAVADVLYSRELSNGPRIEQFERIVAKFSGRQHAVGVSSVTAALHCAMLAAGVSPQDEVITTPFSFVASANCALYVGAKPVFVDIDVQTLNMDAGKVAGAITPRTKAIISVETFGHPGGMIELEQLAQQHELILIEDACEGFGGYVATTSGTERAIGSFGRASTFSFFASKQITCGEGGMIVTDDDTFASACRALRSQGRQSINWLAHHRLGYNYRLDEMSAALGIAQCGRLDEILENRRRVANTYMERLMTNRCLILPTLFEHTHVSWFVFVVRLNDLFEPGDRDDIMHELRAEGIGAEAYFPPIHLQPYMIERFGYKPGDFPAAEYVSARTLALPFFSTMTTSQIHRVCDVLERLLDKTLIARKGGRF